MRIEAPPSDALMALTASAEELSRYFREPAMRELISKTNQEYYYWTELKRRVPPGFDPKLVWALIKVNRRTTQRTLQLNGGATMRFSYGVTDSTLAQLHRFDLYMGGVLRADGLIPAEDKTRYLIGSIMEEAISSSQLEGAATTREVAKDMLRKQRKPRDRSERMIVNNYQTIRFLLERKDQPLTPELLTLIQARMTEGTLRDESHSGRFRDNDNVLVEDATTGEVVHMPPPSAELSELLTGLCEFANTALAVGSAPFIHPIVRACILHFLIGYVHPFFDGNGRTARALFYWYLLRNGYWLVEYLSISRIIQQSAAQYGRAYLQTEHDENDLTYFINYHVRALALAFDSLQQYVARKVAEKRQLSDLIRLAPLNERQVTLVQELLTTPHAVLTIGEVQHRLGVVYQTARADLMGLEALGLLEKRIAGKLKIRYFRHPQFEANLARLRG